MICKNCSTQIPDESIFCPECGHKIVNNQTAPQNPQQQTQSQTAAAQENKQNKAPLPYPPQQPAMQQYQNDLLNAPLSTANFFWMPVILAIPIIGFIILLVWAFSSGTNINRKHYARSVLIWIVVSIVLIIITAVLGRGIFATLINYLR